MAYNTGFICLLLILSAAKAAHYVQTGTDKDFCGFKCYQPQGFLELRFNHKTLFLDDCSHPVPKIYRQVDPRIILNSSSGCWMLRNAQKNYTGTYQFFLYRGHIRSLLKSIRIIVLDAVKIQNITSNSSQGGSEVSLKVQFSGGKASVLWELDGGSLPLRYLLKDDNQTLIIQNASTEDAQRMLTVWVKNPVSEDKRVIILNHLVIKDKGNPNRRSDTSIVFYILFTVFFIIFAVLGMLGKFEYRNQKAGWKNVVVLGF